MSIVSALSADERRSRRIYFAIALSTIPVGLIARSMRDGADHSTLPGFIATCLGDTLWAVLFFFLFATVYSRRGTQFLAALTLAVTVGIELSQLYQGEPLAMLRSFPPTRFLLGTNFLWSDIICLVVGTLLAAAIHAAIPRKRPKHA